jgi:hypothetical protein
MDRLGEITSSSIKASFGGDILLGEVGDPFGIRSEGVETSFRNGDRLESIFLEVELVYVGGVGLG